VQKIALPAILSGKDVILQAQTGSGKTLAYALPIISAVDPNRAAIQALVIVPTRELGLQVAAVMKQLSTGSPKKILVMAVMTGSKNTRLLFQLI
jgi:superfamily II DNA/RNA helicase